MSKNGFYDNAIEKYLLALEMNPEFPEARNNLGVAYAEKNLLNKAIKEFERAIIARPGYREAIRNLDLARNLLNNSHK